MPYQAMFVTPAPTTSAELQTAINNSVPAGNKLVCVSIDSSVPGGRLMIVVE